MPERKRFFLCEVFPNQKRVFPALADGNPPEAGSHTEAGRHRDDRPAACKCNYHHHSHHDYHINNTTIANVVIYHPSSSPSPEWPANVIIIITTIIIMIM